VVVEPAKIVERPVAIVGYFRSRSEPLIPFGLRRSGTISNGADPIGPLIGQVIPLSDSDVSDAAGTHKIGRLLQELRRAALNADLYDTLRAIRRLNHLAAFCDRQAERFLDIDLFAGFTRADVHQGM